MTSHLNTRNNFEESRALKRKRELLYSQEAIIRNELEYAASLSLEQPRMEVVNWLANVKKLRNSCLEATSEDCLPPRQRVDILMHEAQDFERQHKGLFEVRETKTKLLERNMVGEAFRENTTKILEYLVGNKKSLVGIYGMGGVGKTTIMVHIHNRLLEETNCGKVLWITVSQDFHTQSLQDNLWNVLGQGRLQEKDVRKRAAMLCDCLTKTGKSIVILDDVWEHIDLTEVGIPVGVDGIKLVLTTRSIKVCHQMQCQEMIKIEPLRDKEAKRLFLEELGSKVALDSKTRAIVKSIVKECAGLPLAIITMATSMRGATNVFEWEDCLKKLRESDMRETDMEKMVLKKLEFSYIRLGKHEVQQCFLSCALYPEDELINKFELIEFFIDQGLFGQLETRKEQYFRGLTVLKKLANVCLLEDHRSGMTMHDLIRDMALNVMNATSMVKVGKRSRRILYEEYWTDALEKVSLMDFEMLEFPLNMSPNCPKLSTFLMNTMWGLKVLNLSGCGLRELPDSISELINLGALLLRYCDQLHRIPHLGKLRSLRKLDIANCVNVEELEGLEMLVNLRYLDIAHTGIKKLPKGTLGVLLNLQYLNVWATLQCHYEYVDDFNKLVRLVNKQRNNPRYYQLKLSPVATWYCEKESDDARFGNCGRSVYIDMWVDAIVSAGGESSGSGNGVCVLIPQDVQSLTATNCDGATNLSDIGLLENLEELDIYEWKNLRVLCGGQDEEIINIHDFPIPTLAPLLFPSLRVLQLRQCPKLKYLFGHGPKIYLPHLREIKIEECEEMVAMTIENWKNLQVHCGGQYEEIIDIHDSPIPTLAPLLFPSLRVLQLRQCPKLKYLFGHGPKIYLPHLREIKIEECEEMVAIIIENWKNLQVHCGGQDEEIIDIHDSLAPVIFPRLRFLEISCCPKLKYLFGQEPKFYLPHLREIWISACEEMVGITIAVTSPPPHPPPAFPRLESIAVHCCDKMKRVVESEWLPHFPNLGEIQVSGSENMEEIIGGPPSYMPVEEISLKYLGVTECDNMRKLFPHEWVLHLRNLESIDVYGCKGMMEMISGAGQGQEGSITTPVNNTPSSSQSSISLPKLKHLRLLNLPQLKSICEVPITCDSMESLVVSKCPELNRIPLKLRLRDIEDLQHIEVEGEEKWKTLIWDCPDAQALLQSHLLSRDGTYLLEGQSRRNSRELSI
ncbi:hypothetical protein BT93_B0210 [Corymbia citriodora subsp. variegata]|nr:hypothetical protein BT93_B0210 [Corymbia citriodora subsp. variegata]